MSASQVQLSNPLNNRHGCLSEIYHVCQHMTIKVQSFGERLHALFVRCFEWIKDRFIGPFTVRKVPLLFDEIDLAR